MRRSSKLKVGLLTAILLAAIAYQFGISATTPIELPRYGSAPQFLLTNSADEAPFDSKSLKDKTTLLSFFFTSCPTICPAVNGRIATLNRMYSDNPEIQIVSITVDPETDTPAKLREYSARFGANLPKWHFLTGPIEKINELRRDGFKVDPAVNADMHSTRVILIDRTGTVRGFYSGDEDQSMKELARDIQVVIAE